MNIINVKNLTFSYDENKPILNGIDFSIEEESITGLLGDSGSGKSTLCHILCGIIPNAVGGVVSGQINLCDKNLRDCQMKDLAETVGFVMQDPDRQIVTSTVEDELAFGPENLCLEPKKVRERVDEVLELLGLKEIREENPNKLSGGQKQLVAIGSILTMDPEVIILDEPFSHLDEEYKSCLTNIIRGLKLRGKTIIIVEHDHRLIEDADRWILLEDGKVKAFGAPEKVKKYI
ncbi:MAG: ABC transporter ATP-binding protein [Clostridiales bacterium]|nr:ABC transporter ATP-binding protein [Clostridiales bacterium]